MFKGGDQHLLEQVEANSRREHISLESASAKVLIRLDQLLVINLLNLRVLLSDRIALVVLRNSIALPALTFMRFTIAGKNQGLFLLHTSIDFNSAFPSRLYALELLENPSASTPALYPGIQFHRVWKRIRFACCDRRNMILVSVHNSQDLHCCPLQRRPDRFRDLRSFCSKLSGVLLLGQITHKPISVLGVASVTSSDQRSQHTSSSPLPPPVNHPSPLPAFFLFFSKS